MPKQYAQDVKLKAMELWVPGNLSGKQIADQVNEEFGLDIQPSTIYMWAKQYKWADQKNLARTEAVNHIAETEGQRFSRVQKEHLIAYEGLRHKADSALGVLQFDRAFDAAKAMDMGIQGERKIMEGMINLQFVQSVLNVLVEEIDDQELVAKVATKLRTLVQTQA